MDRILVFGNSGAGKSTWARRQIDRQGVAHLDLDTLAWRPTDPPTRAPIAESQTQIIAFMDACTDGHARWVIEGCYADLLALATPYATALIFLDLPVSVCIEHARARSWEPHKYPSQAAQDANLAMLIEWIRAYPDRDGPCGRAAHTTLFDTFAGLKHRYVRPPD